VGRVNIPPHSLIVVDHLNLKGEDYSRRKLMKFTAIGARFERCRFDKATIDDASFGSGAEMSEYVECSFDGARLTMGGGEFARFVRCSFRNVKIDHWFCYVVELVDCVFSGRLETAFFNGAVREEYRSRLGRDQNEFHGNDFSAMDLIDVDFRTGIDLTLQKLPLGPKYTYLPDAEAAVDRARAGLTLWTSNLEARHLAIAYLKTLEKNVQNGQKQMLLRKDTYDLSSMVDREAVDKLFDLLKGEAGGSKASGRQVPKKS